MLSILLHKRQDARGDDPVCPAEVVVDLCDPISVLPPHVGLPVRFASLPWRVNVMDCSSFSSSSVRERLLWAGGPGRDILSWVSRLTLWCRGYPSRILVSRREVQWSIRVQTRPPQDAMRGLHYHCYRHCQSAVTVYCLLPSTRMVVFYIAIFVHRRERPVKILFCSYSG